MRLAEWSAAHWNKFYIFMLILYIYVVDLSYNIVTEHALQFLNLKRCQMSEFLQIFKDIFFADTDMILHENLQLMFRYT